MGSHARLNRQSRVIPPASDHVEREPVETRTLPRPAIRRFAVVIVMVGVVVQLALSAYYLGVGHSPRPRHLPVGFVAPSSRQAAIAAQINAGGSFAARRYPGAAALTRAIRSKALYGGVDVTMQRPHLYVASAAGLAAASAIQTAFTRVLEQETSKQVAALVRRRRPVPPSVVQALTSPPSVTDLAPLPAADWTGGSIGLLVQALALGGSVASLGLGRLLPMTRRSIRRGVAHTLTLVLYAVFSAAAVLWAASWFDIVPGSAAGRLFVDFLLLSLALTVSTAGFVAILGPLGALAGMVYFTLGLIISGSSILPQFLPAFGRTIGQALPTGSGVTAIRDSLYFRAASISGPVLVLGLYAGLGLITVLVTNTRPNESRRIAELRLPGSGG